MEEGQRVKFLCSFSGSILPRPQDGRLRYVGGETRIVSIPHDITYADLMSKMKELLENLVILKYQQPDEDLDALVSVVNDDDVINMMDEYDKLGSADGFTRLRLFLFSHPEQDAGLFHFFEGGSERSYVDALNILNEAPDFRKHPGELSSFDDVHTAEQYFGPMSREGGGGPGPHGLRNMELPMAQMNLRHLTIPHLGSGQAQAQQPVSSQRFSEMEAPWSPAYYSPRHPEFPTSPLSARFQVPFDRFPPETAAGFHGNLVHPVGLSAYEGNNICEHCRMLFRRNPRVRPGVENQSPLTEYDGDVPLELEDDSDNVDDSSKIELTKAEEEAFDRGLQTIHNEDLEEIRELGSGTYGAVYHGKWKGSDVAIKRIKASCFAGRPSERGRLGVVRDGPDSSLATVTEFMINGSLKQCLRKDRTIDRRKRLIIGMDAAFGMEYLHGKNIVHFDLKCENLLVNMRDPHRPVCKIGDLRLSKVKQHTLVSGGVRGTLPWIAPELLSGKANMVTEKIDVYSFGICMWELLTGDEPYRDMHYASIIGGIVNNTAPTNSVMVRP